MALLQCVPRFWYDTCILGTELFKAFQRDLKAACNDEDIQLKIRCRTVERLQACQRSCMSIKVWLNLAFSPLRMAAVSNESIAIFLDFYWNLSQNREAGLSFLNQERHKRGLAHLIAGSHLTLRAQSRDEDIGKLGFTNKGVDEIEESSHGTSNSSTKPRRIKKRKKREGEAAPSKGEEEDFAKKSMDVHVKPGRSKMTTINRDQALEPDGSDGQENARLLKGKSEFRTSVGNKKRKVAENSKKAPSDANSQPDECSPNIIPSAEISMKPSMIYEDLEPTSALSGTLVPCANKPALIPSEISPITDNGPPIRPSSLSTGVALCPRRRPLERDALSVPVISPDEEALIQQAHNEILTTPSMGDASSVVQLPQSERCVEFITKRPMSPKQELSEPDLFPGMAFDELHGEPPELHRIESLSSEPSTGLDHEAAIRPVIPEVELDSDREACFPKPRLPKFPPIWAESRQEVCETFDWFRSYQGGVYHADNTVKGYFLSSFSSSRDAFKHDGKLIISHGGGKSESMHCQQGVTVSHQASDQLAEDKSVRALLDNYRTGRPLVLLVDDKYLLFPYDLAANGVTYAVLGFYSIVYAWAEYQQAKNESGRVMRHKFAFRWCEEQGEPWWRYQTASDHPMSLSLPEDSPEPNVSPFTSVPTSMDKKSIYEPRKMSEENFRHTGFPSVLLPPDKSISQISRVCPVCRNFSHQVYSIWVCLMPNCFMFWKNPEGNELLLDKNIKYNKKFFDLTSQHPLCHGLRLLPPPAITRAINGTSTGYAFTRGIHCPRCGRLSCRYQWEKLECMQCKWIQHAEINIRFAKDFWCDRLPINFEHFHMSSYSDIIVEPMRTFSHDHGRSVVQTFTLPYNRGYLHHIRANNPAGMKEADDIFIHYQEQASSGQLRFRRWPMRAHRCRGSLLTNYFSHNAGEPYHYVGGDANTVPFEQVPAVVEARTLIQKRTFQALNQIVDFNEVLSCAYMERQRMAFHSDAEVGLGPLVAGLSLGSPALMHFRLHARHDPLYERRGILLTVVLRHGDILVMDGAKVQEYYEHTVVPNNFRIAATARQITPRHHKD